MKKYKNTLSILVTSIFFVTSTAYGQSRDVAPMDNGYANPAPNAVPATTVGGDTIQSAGTKSSGNNGTGKMMGMVAMGVTAAGVAMTCFPKTGSPPSKCYYFIAGLVASTAVTMLMGKAKKGSDATVAAVSVGNPNGNGADSTYGGSGIDYSATPQWQAAQDQIAKLEAQGYKFDRTKGTVTTPDGKTLSSDSFSSNAAMSSAGMTPLEIKDINAAKAKMNAEIAAKMKGADGSSFDSDISGGGAGAPTASAAAADGGMNGGVVVDSGLGINRDPAQVAGLTKNLNGQPIGVAGDGIFSMVNKRYQIKEQSLNP